MLSFDSPVITPWHSVAVAFKLFTVCLCSVLLYIFSSVTIQLFALLCIALMYGLCGWRFFIAGLSRMAFLWPVLIVILVWHGVSGTAMQGLGIALRLSSIVALSNLMTMTSRLSDLLDLFKRALKPFRALGINTRPIEIAVALVLRFTPVLIGKGTTLVAAWRMRSVKRPSWRILFPLSLVAIDDAEHVAEALKARGGTHAVIEKHEKGC